MIRFIDLRGQGTGNRLAFWDTVVDRFCDFAGYQAWENKFEFINSYAAPSGASRSEGGRYADSLARFTHLCPAWTEEPMNDPDATMAGLEA